MTLACASGNAACRRLRHRLAACRCRPPFSPRGQALKTTFLTKKKPQKLGRRFPSFWFMSATVSAPEMFCLSVTMNSVPLVQLWVRRALPLARTNSGWRFPCVACVPTVGYLRAISCSTKILTAWPLKRHITPKSGGDGANKLCNA